MKPTMIDSLVSSSWFNDQRLCARFGRIFTAFFNNFGHSVGKMLGNRSQSKATFNFMNNENVTVERLCSSDAYRLQETLGQEENRTVVCISDTTSLNYTTNRSSSKLDYLNTAKCKGYFLHSLMMSDAEGCPEGLLRCDFYNHTEEALYKTKRTTSAALSHQAIEEKESYCWMADLEHLHTLFSHLNQHRFVLTMDAAGDIFELFAARRYEHIHILTRVHHDRKLIDTPLKLKDFIRSQDPQGEMEISITDRKKTEKGIKRTKKTPRIAKVDLKWSKITIQVPISLRTYQKEKAYKPLDLYVVHAKENILTDESKGEPDFEPIDWYLITSLPIDSLEQAVKVIQFYAARWRIEDFHLVLKEGAAVEKLQYDTPHALKNAITMYALVALQVLRWRYLSQFQADQPMEILGIQSNDFNIVAAFIKNVKKVQIYCPENPTVKDCVQLITILGTGDPKDVGVRALWRGLRDFNLIIDTFRFAHSGIVPFNRRE